MKQSELRALEQQLGTLPISQQKHLIHWLSHLLDSQITSLIDTSTDPQCCRHCGSPDFKKWGKSEGLQRYKCKESSCGRTFNALTGTPLARLRHKEQWLAYLLCMIDSLTLRQAAARLDIDLTTAFRWRHRFLSMASKTQASEVNGIIEADETFFKESYKGKRTIPHRSARHRGGQGKRTSKEDQVPVLIVRDRSGQVRDFVFDHLTKEQVHASLRPIVNKDAILCTDGASWYQTFAKQEQIAHHRLIRLDRQRVIGKAFHIQNVNAYIARLKTWMKRFHGVGTAYLANYLGWRRLFETMEISEKAWLRLALS